MFTSVSFSGPNEGYGINGAPDKDPGGIDYKEFGWKADILPDNEQLVYFDPGKGSPEDERKSNINFYIYAFDPEASNVKSDWRKRAAPGIERREKKVAPRKYQQYFLPQDALGVYEPFLGESSVEREDRGREGQSRSGEKKVERKEEETSKKTGELV